LELKLAHAPLVDCVEQKRLNDTRDRGFPWKKWGPYLSERGPCGDVHVSVGLTVILTASSCDSCSNSIEFSLTSNGSRSQLENRYVQDL
jgi:hypothetical protein